MRFPFDNKFAPLMETIGFTESNLDLVLKKYLEWILPQIDEKIVNSKTDKTWNEYNEKMPIIHKLQCSFEELINASLPFYYPYKIILFETKSNWIGCFENNMTSLIRINQAAVRIDEHKQSIGVRAWENAFGKRVNGWGGGLFTLDEGITTKRIIMLSDQDKWEFDEYGEPLPFEDIEKYKEKYARNRFTPEMLQKYLLHYGIDYFNDDFYMPPGSKAYIIEHVRDKYEHEETKTLQQRRIELKYESPS
jgi:hypothetical protein